MINIRGTPCVAGGFPARTKEPFVKTDKWIQEVRLSGIKGEEFVNVVNSGISIEQQAEVSADFQRVSCVL